MTVSEREGRPCRRRPLVVADHERGRRRPGSATSSRLRRPSRPPTAATAATLSWSQRYAPPAATRDDEQRDERPPENGGERRPAAPRRLWLAVDRDRRERAGRQHRRPLPFAGRTAADASLQRRAHTETRAARHPREPQDSRRLGRRGPHRGERLGEERVLVGRADGDAERPGAPNPASGRTITPSRNNASASAPHRRRPRQRESCRAQDPRVRALLERSTRQRPSSPSRFTASARELALSSRLASAASWAAADVEWSSRLADGLDHVGRADAVADASPASP